MHVGIRVGIHIDVKFKYTYLPTRIFILPNLKNFEGDF